MSAAKKLLLLGGSTPVGLPGPLRCVGMRGYVHSSTLAVSSSKTRFKGRFQIKLGNKPVINLRTVWDNFYTTPATTPNQEIDNPDTVGLTKVAMVVNGINRPLTFSGSRSVTLTSGQVDLQTDAVEASSFGLGNYFPAGTTVEVRWIGDHASAAAIVPCGSKADVGFNDQMFRYLPANDIDDVDSTGAMASPTGSDSPAVYSPTMLVGKFLGAGVAMVHIGDSIGDGQDDVPGIGLNGTTGLLNIASGVNGGGYLRRTAYEAGFAYCNMTMGGNRMQWFSTEMTARQQYFKYFTHAITQLGTNDIAGGLSAATIIGTARTIWLALNAQGIQKIYQTLILPKVDTTGDYHQTDTANQTVLSSFGGGAPDNRQLLNAAAGPATAFATNIGATRKLDGVFDIATPVQDGIDYRLWGVLPYTGTLQAGVTGGAGATASVSPSPTLGDTLVFDPGSAGVAEVDRYITAISGSGPYSITLSGNLVNSHSNGAAVRGTPSYDGTHPTCPIHKQIAQLLLPTWRTFTSAT